ncbi:ABC transporter ATP-binding protein [Streptomyces sp. uw30]|nr:ABC transporter ATP-binding protein [Streptomyces sp. uw30]
MLVATWAALGWLAVTSRLDLALAATAVVAVRTCTGALSSLVLAVARLFRTSLYMEDWQAFLHRAEDLRAVRGTRQIPADAPAEIRVEHVSYTYPGAVTPAVDGVSLTLRRGELIALVGENGSGKSTLAALLTGLRIACVGTVSWDGTDLAEADPHTVWAKVGLVPQDFTRWPMDLRANIHLGQPRSANDVLLLDAARAAGADSVIARVPHGLDTLVAGSHWGGTDLSGGQWQRIAVARAFYRDAAMLMLDEPTSAMDPRAEYLVIRRFKELAADKTAVFVTQGLDNARIADRIVVLDRGRVREEGDFRTLMARGGLFAELYRLAQTGGRPPPAARQGGRRPSRLLCRRPLLCLYGRHHHHALVLPRPVRFAHREAVDLHPGMRAERRRTHACAPGWPDPAQPAQQRGGHGPLEAALPGTARADRDDGFAGGERLPGGGGGGPAPDPAQNEADAMWLERDDQPGGGCGEEGRGTPAQGQATADGGHHGLAHTGTTNRASVSARVIEAVSASARSAVSRG